MEKSFTLIELIVVISIIALLGALGITTYSNTQIDARNTRRKSDLKTIETALNSYYSINNRYPTTGLLWFGTCTSYGSHSDSDSDPNPNGPYIPGLAPEFIPRLPRDPTENLVNPAQTILGCRDVAGQNCYLYRSNGTDFKLLAHCTPEGTWSATDPFYDPRRTTYTWQISSSATSLAW